MAVKIENFRDYKTVQNVESATVDVTTGTWWFPRTTTRRLFKTDSSYGWRFLDTGESAYGVGEMLDAYNARAVLADG